jgi:hypothetical protein
MQGCRRIADTIEPGVLNAGHTAPRREARGEPSAKVSEQEVQ